MGHGVCVHALATEKTSGRKARRKTRLCVCVCQSVVEYHQCVWILNPMCDALLARLIGRLERILEYFRVRILARLELWLEDD